MRHVSAFVTVVLGFTLLCATAAFSQADSLWRCAVELADRSRNLTPQTIVTRVELLKSQGEVDHSQEVHLRVSYDENGDPHVQVTKATEDGQDATEKMRERFAARDSSRNGGRRGSFWRSDLGPLEPSRQDSVRVTPLGESKTIDGKACVGYRFELDQRGGGVLRGELWIDKVTAAPLLMTSTPDPLPKRVKRLNTTVRYGQGPDGLPVVTEIVTEGEAGFLFIKKRFRSVLSFSDYVPQRGSGQNR